MEQTGDEVGANRCQSTSPFKDSGRDGGRSAGRSRRRAVHQAAPAQGAWASDKRLRLSVLINLPPVRAPAGPRPREPRGRPGRCRPRGDLPEFSTFSGGPMTKSPKPSRSYRPPRRCCCRTRADRGADLDPLASRAPLGVPAKTPPTRALPVDRSARHKEAVAIHVMTQPKPSQCSRR
jgi:hypothetical protein